MVQRNPSLARRILLLVVPAVFFLLQSAALPAAGTVPLPSGEGKTIRIVVPPSPPPPGFVPPKRLRALPGDVMLSNVPAYSWCYGCSPTAAGMMMGYYDVHGYPNIYTGPANGGVCPLDNEPVWGHTGSDGECPFIASHRGIDGRTTNGYVDDYWGEPDPCLVLNRTAHADDCLGDFMGTSQDRYGMTSDGGTAFYSNYDGTPCYDAVPAAGRDGCHGIRLFAQSRGYTVTTNYTQLVYNASSMPAGFTFAQYCAEIDAGYPVIIQVNGHSMLGMGYNKTGSVVYLHTTWGNYVDQMTWGGSFQGMVQLGVTVVHLSHAPLSNDAPTIDPVANQMVLINSGAHQLTLTGISPGDADDAAQKLTITAASSTLSVIPTPRVSYTSGAAVATLSFSPTNAAGTALITVTVQDNGGTANGGVNTTRMPFLITVCAQSESPFANPGSYGYYPYYPLYVPTPGVLANAFDASNYPITAVKTRDPLHGTLILHPDGSFTYFPVSTYWGPDSFAYKAYNGLGYSSEAVVTLTATRGWVDWYLGTPSPADGAVKVPTAAQLSWTDTSSFANGAKYDVLCDTAFPPKNRVAADLTTCAYGLSALQPGKVYYWQVIAKNGYCRCSAIWRFTTIPPPPLAASHPQPADGATGVSLTPTLAWQGSGPLAPATTPLKRVAIFPASNPDYEAILTAHHIAFTDFGVSDLGKVDLSGYDKVVIWVWYLDGTYSDGISTGINASKAWLENYVKAGGKLDLYVANMTGPGNFSLPLTLPGGFAYTPQYHISLNPYAPVACPATIVDPASPVVTTPNTVNDTDIGMTYGDLGTTPGAAHTIAASVVTFNPTTMDLAFGKGRIFITSQRGGTTQFLEDCLLSTSSSDTAVAYTYDVYCDTVNPPKVKVGSNCPAPSCAAGALQLAKTYYWQVVAKGDGGNTPGPVWKFSTVKVIGKADMLIRNANEMLFTGGGIFNTTGAGQAKTQTIGLRGTAIYYFQAQNAGSSADQLRITCLPRSANWPVRFTDAHGTDITTQMFASTSYLTPVLQPGDTVSFSANVMATNNYSQSSAYTLSITAASKADPTAQDVVKAITLCAITYQPDLAIRSTDASTFTGVSLYNMDGSQQTVAKSVPVKFAASYVVRVRNDGNMPDRFTITVPNTYSGWSAACYLLATNQPLTAKSWSTALLQPGDYTDYLVQVTTNGSSTTALTNTLLLTAVSQADSTKGDAVKAVTSVAQQ